MKCYKKNKKLMNNIAIIILVVIIFYIIKNVFFTKRIEGFGGKEIYEYEKDANQFKFGSGDDNSLSQFSSYVNIYSKSSEKRASEVRKEESENDSANDDVKDKEDFESIKAMLEEKMGADTYRKLVNAYVTDPESEYNEYIKAQKTDNSGGIKVFVSGLFDKIEELVSEMRADNPKLES